jgi:hypothetical protein
MGAINSLTVGAIMCLSLSAANIALNKPVTLNGTFPATSSFCTPNQPQPAASVSHSTGSISTVDIDLQGTFTINSAIVQADDNDAYTLQYRDTTGTYHDWWDVRVDLNASVLPPAPIRIRRRRCRPQQ